jgi:glyoxylase-like metal-dependent hydrolase (beta-lactamase superfamily II)
MIIPPVFRSCYLLLLVSSLLASCALAETSPGKTTPKTSAWFKAQEVAENTWRIDDHGVANVYLVIGRDRALLIDTGCGAANLRGFVRSITSLPLTVINTHGHPDHVGANYQFGAILANRADFPAIESMATPELLKPYAGMLGGAVVLQDEQFRENVRPLELRAVREGDAIDLGGRQIEVIETPGHTPGEIVLLDKQQKLLFAGDNDNTLVWLHLSQCLPLEVYLKSLEKVQSRSSEFTMLLPGHGGPIDRDFVAEQITCVKSILAGTARSELYQSFAGDGQVARFERASVVFDPNKLRIEK